MIEFQLFTNMLSENSFRLSDNVIRSLSLAIECNSNSPICGRICRATHNCFVHIVLVVTLQLSHEIDILRRYWIGVQFHVCRTILFNCARSIWRFVWYFASSTYEMIIFFINPRIVDQPQSVAIVWYLVKCNFYRLMKYYSMIVEQMSTERWDR